MTMVWLYVILVLPNVRLGLSNVTKNKETTECDNDSVICDVDIA